MLDGAHILIVEDEALVALDLAVNVIEAEGQIIGPCASVVEAIALLDMSPRPDAAILDISLPGGDVTPLAFRLMDDGIPILFHSGSPVPPEVAARTIITASCPKVAPATRVLEGLRDMLQRRKVST